MTLYTPKFMVTDEATWIKERANYLTSTDAAALLGLDRYKTANQVRQTKLHGSDEPDDTAKKYFALGHKWEQYVIDYGTAALGFEDKLLHTQGFYVLEDVKLAATPDAVFTNNMLIEAKCTGRKNFMNWAKEPPIKYVVQAQVQLMVTNATCCYLVGVFFEPWPDGEPKPTAGIIYKISKSAKLQKKILDKVRKFWDNINIENYRYVVPSFEKEENLKMTQETVSLLKTEEFSAFFPHNGLTNNDLQIIRQVALEASLTLNGDYMPVQTILGDAKKYMNAYNEAIDLFATKSATDPLSKNVIIALQSAMKRAASLKTEFSDLPAVMVAFALFTVEGN